MAVSASVSVAILKNTSEFRFTIPIYIASLLAVHLAYSIHKKRSAHGEIIDGVMKGMARVANYQSAKMPLPNALGKASRFSGNESASKILLESSRRIKMGESLFDSLISSAKSKDIGKEIARYLKGPDSSAGESALLYERVEKARAARRSALAARYATLGMFVSTVAPSFAIFSFIGSMMISPTDSGMFMLSVSLTAAIPVAYAAINILSERSLD